MPLTCDSMEFSTAPDKSTSSAIGSEANLLLRGEIRPGDYDRLIKFAIDRKLDLPYEHVILASLGGDISEALKLGQLIKSLYVEVEVTSEYGPCVSACFIIYASAVARDYGGYRQGKKLVGIHRPYVGRERLQALSPSDAERLETQALLDAENYLHRLRVPNNLVDEMFEHASTEVRWLSDDELEHQVGRKAPWYEEFLIARCGFDKAAEESFLTLDPKYGPELPGGIYVYLAKHSASYNCAMNLTMPEAEQNFTKAIAAYKAQLQKSTK